MKKLCNILIELGISALIIFPPIAFGAVQAQHLTYIHLLILSLLLAWSVKVFVKGIFTHRPTPLDLPLLLFFGWGFVNLWTSSYGYQTERELYLCLNYALLYFLVLQQLKTVRRILGLVFIIILVGSGESLFGLFQYMKGATTVLGVLTPNVGTLSATYLNHNHFAGFLNLIIPLALGLLIGTANREKKFFVLLLIGLMATALILTLSRGGLLSFLLAAGVFIGSLVLKDRFSPKMAGLRPYLLAFLGVAVLVGTYIAWIGVSPIAHRSLWRTFFPTEETVLREIRLPLWRNALALVAESPVFGSGLGTFADVFLRYRPAELPENIQVTHAHNDYLELLVEMGLPGLLLALWALLRFFRFGFKGYWQSRDPVLTPLVLGGLTSCAAMGIHSFFDFNLHIPANALLFTMAAALTVATVQLMAQRHRPGTHAEKALSATRPRKEYQCKPGWVFLLVVIGAIGILAFNFRHHLAEKYYIRARLAQYQNPPFQAIPLYQKAMLLERGNALWHEALGKLYQELGQRAPHAEKWRKFAAQEFHRAIALNPYNPAYYYLLGWTYAALGMPGNAVQAFEAAIAHNPRISFYEENLGNYALSIKQLELAVQRYRKALQLNPARMPDILKTCLEYRLPYQQYQRVIPATAASRKLFAALLAQQGNWDASKAEYRQALALSGKQPEYYQAMLTACRQRPDYECMRALWQELAQQQPENLDFLKNIAESFVQQQLWPQAIAQYQAILAKQPDHFASRQRLAQLYQQQGRPADALQEYARIIALQPENGQLYDELANIYRQQQQWPAAIGVYQKALAQGLKQAAIYANLGELYLQNGDEANALAMFQAAAQAGETRLSVYQTLERLSRTQKNKAAAEVLWETYVVVNKHNPEALFQLVRHYQQSGEWLKAVTLSKEVIANAPANPNYRKFLADLYEQKGMLLETIDQWEKLVQFDAGNIDYLLKLAALHERADQRDNARMIYRKILRLQPNQPQAQQRLASLGG